MGAASTAVSCVCSSLSLPCPVHRPAVALGRFLTLDLVVRFSSTSSAEMEFWRPGTLCWSPVHSTLRRLENLSIFRGYGSGFLPPTASRSFIGGTSAWSGPLLRVTAISLAFGLATAVFRCGGGSCTGMVSILASSRLSLLWVFSGLVQVLACLTLSVPVGVRSVLSPAGFSSLWLCLVERI